MAIDKREVLKTIEVANKPLGIRELLTQGGFHPGQQTDLKRVLRDLVRDGRIEKLGKRFVLPGGPVHTEPPPVVVQRREAKAAGTRVPEKRAPTKRSAEPWAARPPRAPKRLRGENLVDGILHVHRDGFGFVHPLTGDGENVYLPVEEAQLALDGDRVLVELVEGRGGRTAGAILDVLERRRQRVVGVYHQQGRRAWVSPNDKSLPGDVAVPPTQLARDGDLVKVVLGIGASVLEPGTQLFGEVVGAIGRPGEPSGEVLSIAYSNGFSDEFPDEVMAEADHYKIEVTDEELEEEGRRDVRSLPLLTIDGADARDFDDAVYAEPTAQGWRLVVAIADVTHYVREGMTLDAEALNRATSVYLPDRVLPMLPERLSNGICSLRPDEDRLCMVADMRLSREGILQSSELYPAVMRSAARCTYEEVQDVLDGKNVPHRNLFRPHFENLWAIAQTLHRMRRGRGALDFDLPEYKIVVGDDGLPVKMQLRERLNAHRLIEECMLAANEAVARFFQERDLPCVYRFHGEPDEEKLAVFAALARAHGFMLGAKGEITARELNGFLEQLEGHPERRALNQLLLRSMMQAVYSAENVGHYGLGAEHYLHFTSPIRRYPDLLVHRLLKAHWMRGGKVPPKYVREQETERLEAMAVQSSERERAAMSTEREVSAYYATLLMKDRIGEEFDGTIAGIADFGFFVELDEAYVEGLVRGELLGPGMRLDPATHALTWPNGRRLKVGERLRVRLVSANLERRQLDLEPVSFPGEAALEPRAPAPSRERPRRGAATRVSSPRPAPAMPSAPPVPVAPERPSPRTYRAPERAPRPRPAEAPVRTVEAPLADVPQRRVRTWEEEEASREASGSPHPGFDRLRALAAQKGGRGGKPAKGKGGGAGRTERRVVHEDTRTAPRGEERTGRGRQKEAEPARDKFGNPKRPKTGGAKGPKSGKKPPRGRR